MTQHTQSQPNEWDESNEKNERTQPTSTFSRGGEGDAPMKRVRGVKRWLLVLLTVAVFVGVLTLIFYFLPSADAVLDLNCFLFTHYGTFLALRLGVYGVMSVVVWRIRKRVIGTPYYRSYCRTCALCGVMVVLNEVMLLVRVMGG